MKPIVAIALAACLVLAQGCGRPGEETEGEAAARDTQDQSPYEQEFVTADTSEGYETNAPAPVTPTQGGGTFPSALTATGNLVGPGQNGAVGSVTVTEAGQGGAQVRIKIDKYASGTRLQAAVLQGGCRGGREIAKAGQPFEVEPTGFATLVASVQQPAAALLDGSHAVQVSTVGASPAVVGCAALPALKR